MGYFDEWDLNNALDSFFEQNPDHMVIFQDGDLHFYTDRHLKRVAELVQGLRNPTRTEVLTRRRRHISVDPQGFRPDGILIDRHGRPCILETKTQRVNTQSACDALVAQALIYADTVISPRWRAPSICRNDPPSTTYDLLEDLHEAHWFMRVHGEGIYRPLEVRHQKRFKREEPLSRLEFEQRPAIIFLLDVVNLRQLTAARERVRDMEFAEYNAHAQSSLRKSDRFRKHLGSLKGNWQEIRNLDFYLMRVDTQKLAQAIDDRPVLL